MCKNMDVKKDFCTYISTISPGDLSLDILYFCVCSKCFFQVDLSELNIWFPCRGTLAPRRVNDPRKHEANFQNLPGIAKIFNHVPLMAVCSLIDSKLTVIYF